MGTLIFAVGLLIARDERRSCRSAGRDSVTARRRPRCARARRCRTGVVLARSARTHRRRWPPLDGPTTADLAVVGGGFTGLWTALMAKERDPDRDVVVLEARQRPAGPPAGATAASARPASPTAWPTASSASATRSPTLEKLGQRQPRRDRGGRSRRYGIDCDFERTGELSVATRRWQVDGLREGYDEAGGSAATSCCSTATRCGPRSPRRPTWAASGTATAARSSTRPGWPGVCGRRACAWAYGSTKAPSVESIDQRRRGAARCGRRPASVTAAPRRAGHRRVPGAAAAAARLSRAGLRLRADDRAADARSSWPSIGWRNRQGVGDTANQFHYYRLTADNRILWGGYDAVYYNGGRITTGARSAAGDVRASSPRTSSRRSRSSTACGSPTPGAA